MNKNHIILFTVSALVVLLFFSCFKREEPGYVSREFSWLISKKPFLKNPATEEKDWYHVYNLNSEQIEQMLKNNFSEFKYHGWKICKERRLIGIKKTFRIKGDENNIMVNIKEGSDPYNQIAMFIDLTEKKLILFYGITYGI